MTIAPKSDPSKAEPVDLQNASADFSQDNWHVAGAIDGNEDTGWAVSPQFGKTHEAIFETKADAGHEGGSRRSRSRSRSNIPTASTCSASSASA